MEKIMKKINLIIILALSFTLSGCFTTMLWEDNKVVYTKTTSSTVMNDKIYAVAKTSKVDKKTNKTDTNTVILGNNYIYVLDKPTGEAFLNIYNKIPHGEYLAPCEKDEALKFELNKENLVDFSSKIRLCYTSKQKLTKQDKKVLKELKFSYVDDKKLYLYLPIKGTLHSYVDGEKDKLIKNKFYKLFDVQFYTSDSTKSLDPVRLLENIAQTPIALVTDAAIITFVAIAYPLMIFEKLTN